MSNDHWKKYNRTNSIYLAFSQRSGPLRPHSLGAVIPPRIHDLGQASSAKWNLRYAETETRVAFWVFARRSKRANTNVECIKCFKEKIIWHEQKTIEIKEIIKNENNLFMILKIWSVDMSVFKWKKKLKSNCTTFYFLTLLRRYSSKRYLSMNKCNKF